MLRMMLAYIWSILVHCSSLQESVKCVVDTVEKTLFKDLCNRFYVALIPELRPCVLILKRFPPSLNNLAWRNLSNHLSLSSSADMQWFEETKFFPDWSPCFGTIQIKGTKRWVFFVDQAKKLFSKSMVFNLNMAIKPLPLTGTHILNPMAVFTLNDLMKLICDTDSTKQAPRKGIKSIKLPR